MRIWYNDAFKAGYEKGFAKAKKLLDDIDTINVVRCKDCKHRQKDTIFKKLYCDGREVVADGFCEKGERDETD